MTDPKLPAWAEWHPAKGNTVLVDPDKAYPAMLQQMGVPVDQATKFHIESAFQHMKLDLQAALGRFNFTIHVRADDGRKDRWALSRFPGSNADIVRATRDKQARAIYKQTRGGIPS